MIAISAGNERIGLFVIDELLGLGIERERATQTRGNVAQMAERRREMADQGVGGELGVAANGVTEVPYVGDVVLPLWLDSNLDRRVTVAADFDLAAAAQVHLSLAAVE